MSRAACRSEGKGAVPQKDGRVLLALLAWPRGSRWAARVWGTFLAADCAASLCGLAAVWPTASWTWKHDAFGSCACDSLLSPRPSIHTGRAHHHAPCPMPLPGKPC
ncbi:hypothetical protein T440DRAFT_451177 [Plenodomus tracheiphilus IPT5]|uniref:Uncharacterized protein n=1 Tax=Plenodomus tracheiphilus IPT5 TaxID=1408161 RepID=A0A6A7B3L0_9PLEO|nr:hypothetical protein T440DRAFT_451177 [Plenodomus tracheiphilus IPT5]